MAEQQPNTSEQNKNAAPAKKQCQSLEDKLKLEREKHSMTEQCDCPRSCISQINQRRHIQIYLEFWKIPYYEWKNFIHHSVGRHQPKICSPAAPKKREVIYVHEIELIRFHCT